MEAAQQARRSQRDDDWQRVAELLAEEVVWQVAGDGTGQLWRARRGRAEVLAALQMSQNSWSRLQTRTVNAFADGDQVLVEQESTVLGEDRHPRVKPVAFVFLVADGRVAQISTYRNDGGAAVTGVAQRLEETSWPCRIPPTWPPATSRPRVGASGFTTEAGPDRAARL